MKQILKNLFILKEGKFGDPSSTIYLLDSDDVLILFDTGLGFNFKTELKTLSLNPKNIKHCLITHGHPDHLGGCNDLIKLNPKIRIYIHEKDFYAVKLSINKERYIKFPIFYKFKEKQSNLTLGRYKIKCIHIPGHTPGGMAYLSTINNQKVLFVGDICGGGIQSSGGNYHDFKQSLQVLLELKADILCDGHMNSIQSSEEVYTYIKGCQKINEYLHIGFDIDPKNSTNWYKLAEIFYNLKIYDNAYDACKYALKLDVESIKTNNLLRRILEHNPPKQDVISGIVKKIYGENS